MRFWYCKKREKLISYRDELPPPTINRFGRSAYVITDTVDPFLSHADGLYYDSKRAYRESLKLKGYEEIGTEDVNLDRLKQEKEAREAKAFEASFEESFETAWSDLNG